MDECLPGLRSGDLCAEMGQESNERCTRDPEDFELDPAGGGH